MMQIQILYRRRVVVGYVKHISACVAVKDHGTLPKHFVKSVVADFIFAAHHHVVRKVPPCIVSDVFYKTNDRHADKHNFKHAEIVVFGIAV